MTKEEPKKQESVDPRTLTGDDLAQWERDQAQAQRDRTARHIATQLHHWEKDQARALRKAAKYAQEDSE